MVPPTVELPLLRPGERAVLQFSGGKDSTALLYLARPWLSQIEVHFGDTGAVFPHVRRHVEETCAKLGATLRLITPPESVRAYTERVGLPADIVPVEASDLLPMGGGTALQPYTRCCAAMLWQPLYNAVKASGATVVLRGSKASDARLSVPDGHIEDGITYRSPLWHWSDVDVMAYLEEQGASLPAHYGDGVRDSLDCTICTAHLPHHGAEKLRWMREHAPELYAETAERVERMRSVLLEHVQRISSALNEVRQ